MVVTGSPLSARSPHAGRQACQGDRGIPQAAPFAAEDMPRKPLDRRRAKRPLQGDSEASDSYTFVILNQELLQFLDKEDLFRSEISKA